LIYLNLLSKSQEKVLKSILAIIISCLCLLLEQQAQAQAQVRVLKLPPGLSKEEKKKLVELYGGKNAVGYTLSGYVGDGGPTSEEHDAAIKDRSIIANQQKYLEKVTAKYSKARTNIEAKITSLRRQSSDVYTELSEIEASAAGHEASLKQFDDMASQLDTLTHADEIIKCVTKISRKLGISKNIKILPKKAGKGSHRRINTGICAHTIPNNIEGRSHYIMDIKSSLLECLTVDGDEGAVSSYDDEGASYGDDDTESEEIARERALERLSLINRATQSKGDRLKAKQREFEQACQDIEREIAERQAKIEALLKREAEYQEGVKERRGKIVEAANKSKRLTVLYNQQAVVLQDIQGQIRTVKKDLENFKLEAKKRKVRGRGKKKRFLAEDQETLDNFNALLIDLYNKENSIIHILESIKSELEAGNLVC
jgi:chromosome segregation ATPase